MVHLNSEDTEQVSRSHFSRHRNGMEKQTTTTASATPPALLTTGQAADYLGLSVFTLQRWRSDHAPWRPPAVRIGARKIAYRQADLDAWLTSRLEVA